MQQEAVQRDDREELHENISSISSIISKQKTVRTIKQDLQFPSEDLQNGFDSNITVFAATGLMDRWTDVPTYRRNDGST